MLRYQPLYLGRWTHHTQNSSSAKGAPKPLQHSLGPPSRFQCRRECLEDLLDALRLNEESNLGQRGPGGIGVVATEERQQTSSA